MYHILYQYHILNGGLCMRMSLKCALLINRQATAHATIAKKKKKNSLPANHSSSKSCVECSLNLRKQQHALTPANHSKSRAMSSGSFRGTLTIQRGVVSLFGKRRKLNYLKRIRYSSNTSYSYSYYELAHERTNSQVNKTKQKGRVYSPWL